MHLDVMFCPNETLVLHDIYKNYKLRVTIETSKWVIKNQEATTGNRTLDPVGPNTMPQCTTIIVIVSRHGSSWTPSG